jgi:hypothetical protein
MGIAAVRAEAKAEARRRTKRNRSPELKQAREHHTLVISRWLNLCRSGQWTSFEAAKAIERELDRAGYHIVRKSNP